MTCAKIGSIGLGLTGRTMVACAPIIRYAVMVPQMVDWMANNLGGETP